jgi:hypothetical protein
MFLDANDSRMKLNIEWKYIRRGLRLFRNPKTPLIIPHKGDAVWVQIGCIKVRHLITWFWEDNL